MLIMVCGTSIFIGRRCHSVASSLLVASSFWQVYTLAFSRDTRRPFTSLYIHTRTHRATEPLMPPPASVERRFCKVKWPRTAPPRRAAPWSAGGAPPAEPRGGPGHPARRKPRPEGEPRAQPPGRTARPRCATRPASPWDHRQAAAGRRGARPGVGRRGSRRADAPRAGSRRRSHGGLRPPRSDQSRSSTRR